MQVQQELKEEEEKEANEQEVELGDFFFFLFKNQTVSLVDDQTRILYILCVLQVCKSAYTCCIHIISYITIN